MCLEQHGGGPAFQAARMKPAEMAFRVPPRCREFQGLSVPLEYAALVLNLHLVAAKLQPALGEFPAKVALYTFGKPLSFQVGFAPAHLNYGRFPPLCVRIRANRSRTRGSFQLLRTGLHHPRKTCGRE
jgi:hypothetical protein